MVLCGYELWEVWYRHGLVLVWEVRYSMVYGVVWYFYESGSIVRHGLVRYLYERCGIVCCGMVSILAYLLYPHGIRENTHWLPAPQHIQVKILTPMHLCLFGAAPSHLETFCALVPSLPCAHSQPRSALASRLLFLAGVRLRVILEGPA